MKIKRNRKTCRKIRYSSPAEARRALRELKHTSARRFCRRPYCGGAYHLTSRAR